jgi:hypothetical protein
MLLFFFSRLQKGFADDQMQVDEQEKPPKPTVSKSKLTGVDSDSSDDDSVAPKPAVLTRKTSSRSKLTSIDSLSNLNSGLVAKGKKPKASLEVGVF